MKLSNARLSHPLYKALMSALTGKKVSGDTEDIRRVDAPDRLWDYAPYIPSVPLRKVHHNMFEFFDPAEADLWELAGTGAASYGSNTAYEEGSWGTVFVSSPGSGDYATAIGESLFGTFGDDDIWYEAKVYLSGDTSNFKGFIGISNMDWDGAAWAPPDAELYEAANRVCSVGIDFGSLPNMQLTVTGQTTGDAGYNVTRPLGIKFSGSWFTIGFHIYSSPGLDILYPHQIVEFYLDGVNIGDAVINWTNPGAVPYPAEIMVLSMSIAGFSLEETKMVIDWIRFMKADPHDDP